MAEYTFEEVFPTRLMCLCRICCFCFYCCREKKKKHLHTDDDNCHCSDDEEEQKDKDYRVFDEIIFKYRSKESMLRSRATLLNLDEDEQEAEMLSKNQKEV